MKIKNCLFGIIMAIVLSGCYNDDKLWNALDEQEQRIEALESWQKVMNSNIEALQSLVDGQDYITKVTPVTLNGEVVGYTITFKSQSPITIYNGEKGDKGDKGDTGATGAKGDKGETGAAGAAPVRGTDYWTAADIATIKSYVDAAILNGTW